MLTISAPAFERPVVPADSAAWVKARLGHLTASRMKDVMATSKRDGRPLKARADYAMELVAERLTGIASTHYVTSEMEWGLAHEAAAMATYTEVTGNKLQRAGFIQHPRVPMAGATPDAFVLDDDGQIIGLVEFKCPKTTTHLEWKIADEVPHEHKPQMLWQASTTGLPWVDFASYDPRLPARQRMFIKRFTPTAEELELVEKVATQFVMVVDTLETAAI
jgi:predicted phage-related endonuclease